MRFRNYGNPLNSKVRSGHSPDGRYDEILLDKCKTFLRDRRYGSYIGRYWGCKEGVAGPPIGIFSKSSRVFLATCGLALSRRSTIPFESLPLRLLLMVWPFVDYVMHNSFAYRQLIRNHGTVGYNVHLPTVDFCGLCDAQFLCLSTAHPQPKSWHCWFNVHLPTAHGLASP
ncbi:hypothetical protein AVEN_218123-1 [Araneus ventricosus]|uniref:Uncharacterized protein n=1 Tax=Araneus ventricosus TaxID=182803 RepID=A0A4Y2I5S4_ARAVE|nr:hypothetical protein AVEN_218123-1 [Araneus ventricosus]